MRLMVSWGRLNNSRRSRTAADSRFIKNIVVHLHRVSIQSRLSSGETGFAEQRIGLKESKQGQGKKLVTVERFGRAIGKGPKQERIQDIQESFNLLPR